EKINAYVNDDVEQGAILAQLYSQEFMTIQSEFLQAASRLKRARSSNEAERKATNSIYESVKRKLRILGLSNKEVSDIETSAEASAYFIVRAQFSGTIINSNTKVGEVVEISTELFELADLATLWVLADIYEKDLPHITKGMKSLVEISASQEPFQGVIETIYNVVDEKTRTVKARIEVQNKKAMLKPGMFCTVKVQTALGKETIKIPASALLGETEKHFVFVSVNDTTFERRDVRTGVETREFAEILDGLLEGEQVVVKGGFFLKSELAKETFGEEH
ncbi:MAG: efflux RND transporter periplasmic adaptor subunit, partial [Bacteroidetes bacterium]